MTAVRADESSGQVTRADIEAKLREIRGGVDSGVESARNVGLIVGAVAAVAIVGVVYFMGRRRGRRQTTVVEVRRV
jgi:tetrahydromethanopterin S-methyltransferase subunit F